MAKIKRAAGGRGGEILDREKNLLGELIHTHQALMNLFSREVGMAPARLNLIHVLLHAGPAGIGVGELAAFLGVTPALVTRQANEFEAAGWVRREGDPRDGRRSRLVLTAPGRREGAVLHQRAHLFLAALMEKLDPTEVAVAERVLSQLRGQLGSMGGTLNRVFEGRPTEDGSLPRRGRKK